MFLQNLSKSVPEGQLKNVERSSTFSAIEVTWLLLNFVLPFCFWAHCCFQNPGERGQFSKVSPPPPPPGTHRIVVTSWSKSWTLSEPSPPKQLPSASTRLRQVKSPGHCAPPAARLAFAWNVNARDSPAAKCAMCHTTEPFCPTFGSLNGVGLAWSLYIV